MCCSNLRIAARIRPIVAERLVEGTLRVKLLEHRNPEHEIIYELRLNQSRFLGPADPPEFLVILLVLFL